MSSIGKNIKRAREAAGIKTQGALAKRLCVPQPQLSDWENDRYGALDTKTLMKIAAAIPCSLDALVQGLDAQYDKTRDLPRHGRTGQLTPHQEGGADVPAEARAEIDRLGALVKTYETRLSEMQDVASRLVKLAALGSEKERATTRAESGSRARDRKTG